MLSENKSTNRLGKEKSPYLLQHAANPVDWFPWGEEAFARAKEENKPVFLSIGYSTCHWCHVMEQESFENQEVAFWLNRYFVAVKVDREERPDIDSVYMTVCQALAGQGGWPLTILMTADRKPFYAATYLPKASRYGAVGLLELLPQIVRLWRENPASLLEQGEKVTRYVRGLARSESVSSDYLAPATLEIAFRQFCHRFDNRYGGFGDAPKFPSPHTLLFLLRYSVTANKDLGRNMAEKTLMQMYRGGLFDHVGGGFSRYSTDQRWLVPHFEKMLYDNALLAYAYLEAFQLTKRELYRTVAKRTLDYILEELTDPEGGFYCSQDADSEGVEGRYYVFHPEELHDLLGEEDGGRFCQWFGILPEGNFEGNSIPNLLNNDRYEENPPDIGMLCSRVASYRQKRCALRKDDKILTSWNGLAIAAFAKAFAVLGEERYLYAAQKGETFLWNHLARDSGRWFVRYRDGEAAGEGTLDDYAFLSWAFIELYQTTFDVGYLKKTIRNLEMMLSQFWDERSGGFFLTGKEEDALLFRPKEYYDGALPSGNAVAAWALVWLANITGEGKWQKWQEQQIAAISREAKQYPAGFCFFLLASIPVLYPANELICLLPSSADIPLLLRRLRERYVFRTVVLVKTKENSQELETLCPSLISYGLPAQKPVYFLCSGKSCYPPMEEWDKLILQWEENPG